MGLLFGIFMPLLNLQAGQSPEAGFSYSFLAGKPVPSQLSKIGPGAESVVQTDAQGLRITPPLSENQTQGWGVAGNFPLIGDFEVTASYELKTADRPTKGVGSGVALNVVLDQARNKFAKVGRFALVNGQQVYVAEGWTKKNSPPDYHSQMKATASRSGKLRLRREGAVLYFLAADGTEDDFQEIQKFEFGADDLAIVRFVANTNSSPTALDAVLTEFTIVSENLANVVPAASPLATLNMLKTKIVPILCGVLLAIFVITAFVLFVLSKRGKATNETPPAQ